MCPWIAIRTDDGKHLLGRGRFRIFYRNFRMA
jgi:hypothetical protein